MPPTTQPPHLRHLGVLAGDTRNQLTQLVSRQGLESGLPGPEGPEGGTGPEGPPAKTFEHTQGAPSALWTIVHKLKRFPSVVVQDTAGDSVEGIVEYISNEELTITFSAAFSGVAYLN